MNKLLQLLEHKYKYYVQDAPTISDYEYDMLERAWIKEEKIDIDTYPNWVGFDRKHPLAYKIIEKMEK